MGLGAIGIAAAQLEWLVAQRIAAVQHQPPSESMPLGLPCSKRKHQAWETTAMQVRISRCPYGPRISDCHEKSRYSRNLILSTTKSPAVASMLFGGLAEATRGSRCQVTAQVPAPIDELEQRYAGLPDTTRSGLNRSASANSSTAST